MLTSSVPAKLPKAFADSGTKNSIPAASQIGITPGAASLTDGFPPLTMTPIASGGVPPSGADMNGILNLLSAHTKWMNAGGTYTYDAAFATAIGGYPNCALVQKADNTGWWVSTVDGNTSNPDTGGAGWLSLVPTQSNIIGAMRNGRMSITSASASGTFTADEIVVESALGGLAYKIASYNKTINLGTTGAGGMDTGSAPASGYVALYAIYNPSTGTAGILAEDTTSSIAPEVYGGSSMPSGYTASALISVWGTNSSRQFVIGSQRDRLIAFPDVQAFTINNDVYVSISGTLSLSGVAPKNAYSLFGNLAMATLGSTTVFGFGFTGVNKVGISGYASYQSAPFSDLILASPQTLSYGVGVGSSPVNVTLYVDGYKF